MDFDNYILIDSWSGTTEKYLLSTTQISRASRLYKASTAAVFPLKALMKVYFVIPFRNGSRKLIPIENKLPTIPGGLPYGTDRDARRKFWIDII